ANTFLILLFFNRTWVYICAAFPNYYIIKNDMIIGVPKEIKNNENRVGVTPAGVIELTRNGHTVYVQATAGEGSGFQDDDYEKAGASILPSIEEVYGIAEMIIKVKEPIESEYNLIKEDQLLF